MPGPGMSESNFLSIDHTLPQHPGTLQEEAPCPAMFMGCHYYRGTAVT